MKSVPVQSAWALWFRFRKEALRSWWLRISLIRRGVYIGEGARIPGGGTLSFMPSASVQRHSVLNARRGATIHLGHRSRIGANAVISAVGSIRIGDDVLIADRVFIADHHHGHADPDRAVIDQGASSAEPVLIDDGCWLGINVCVMPGVTLGPGCIVGAGSVVTRSFPARCILAGAPARQIGRRDAIGDRTNLDESP